MTSNRYTISRRLGLSLVTVVFLTLVAEPSARAQEQTSQSPDLQQMQKKMEQLEKELLELKQQMNAVAGLSKQAVPGPSIAVTTDTRQAEEHAEQPKPSSSISFYGYAMADSGFNFGSINPDWFDVERPTKLPAFTNEFGHNGNFYAGVRQTRFGVKLFTPKRVCRTPKNVLPSGPNSPLKEGNCVGRSTSNQSGLMEPKLNPLSAIAKP